MYVGKGRDGKSKKADQSATNNIGGDVSGGSVQANTIHGNVSFNTIRRAMEVVPAQLPSCPPHFTARQAEIEQLNDLLAGSQSTPLLVVITGQGGVGKTSLGLCWLHRVSEAYADGQLYFDLQGFSGAEHASSEDALASFLRALGVQAEDIPLALDEQTALFRSMVAGRRMVVLLDNAVSAAQIRPLLPGRGSLIVLVTSRLRLSGLAMDGASFLELDPLNEHGAFDLLSAMLGVERANAEAEKTRRLAELCGRLPLALCISAARLSARRRWSIGRIVDELADERHRLAALSIEDEDNLSMRAVIDASYAALPDEAARLYRLLGLHPGQNFDVSLAASVGMLGEDAADTALDALVGANLLEEEASGAFRFHDLLRLHARTLAQQLESSEVQDSVLRRIVDYYVFRAGAADIQIIPGRWRLGSAQKMTGSAPEYSRAEALAWLEAELSNIVSALRLAYDHEMYRQAWELCECLWPLFIYRKHYREWLDTHRIGLDAARQCGDPLAEARVLEQLGSAYLNLRDFAAAADHAARAAHLERLNGHVVGEATALEVLGIAELELGRPVDAINKFSRSKDLNAQEGVRRGVAIMDRRLGDAFAVVGQVEDGVAHLEQAREFFAADGDRYNEMRTLTSIARLYHGNERSEDALSVLLKAMNISVEIGAKKETADLHVMLSGMPDRLVEESTRQEHLRAALRIYLALNAPQADEVRALLEPVQPDR